VSRQPAQLEVYRTAIPMRGFEHAAAGRDLAEAVVVRLELPGGPAGWGETLPREYVTGETLQTVPGDIEGILWPAARSGDPSGRDLPAADGDRPITAGRSASAACWARSTPPARPDGCA
jgi:L-alanine-DL-glutamate epimerase-like enolase superfamily enzyme